MKIKEKSELGNEVMDWTLDAGTLIDFASLTDLVNLEILNSLSRVNLIVMKSFIQCVHNL